MGQSVFVHVKPLSTGCRLFVKFWSVPAGDHFTARAGKSRSRGRRDFVRTDYFWQGYRWGETGAVGKIYWQQFDDSWISALNRICQLITEWSRYAHDEEATKKKWRPVNDLFQKIFFQRPLFENFLKKKGKSDQSRDGSLYTFEKTTELVDTGIFKTIRHPLYSSLLFLTWGIFLKHVTLYMLVFALLSTAFLFATALMEERENIAFFGEKYREYMKRTKMFIPYIL